MCGCMSFYVHSMCAVPMAARQGWIPLELELQAVVSCMMCVWGTKPGPLQEQHTFLTTEPSPALL